jgi:hypothetical protein
MYVMVLAHVTSSGPIDQSNTLQTIYVILKTIVILYILLSFEIWSRLLFTRLTNRLLRAVVDPRSMF